MQSVIMGGRDSYYLSINVLLYLKVKSLKEAAIPGNGL